MERVSKFIMERVSKFLKNCIVGSIQERVDTPEFIDPVHELFKGALLDAFEELYSGMRIGFAGYARFAGFMGIAGIGLLSYKMMEKREPPKNSEIADQGEDYKELKTILDNKLSGWTAKTENSCQAAAANLEPEHKSKGKKKRNSTDKSSQPMVTEDKCFNSGEGFVEVSQGQIN